METLENVPSVANEIRALAARALNVLPRSGLAYRISRIQWTHPIDYMRYAEFQAILKDLQVEPTMQILDIGSPQWFSLYLANKYPKAMFHYVNIVASEIDLYQRLAEAIGIQNLRYERADVRNLPFASGMFDKTISISVIEHVYPEVGGDLIALKEIKRILRSNGEFLLTVPFKERRNIVYMNGVVYERDSKKRNFFAREYDKEMFYQLIESSGFTLRDRWFICERSGMFAKDYYEWGPGNDKNSLSKNLLKLMSSVERFAGIPIDFVLAKRYLSVSREITNRAVNISAALIKPT